MAGGVITTGAHPKALWPGVHAFWGQVYNEHPTEYTDLYDVMMSDQAYEQDVQITGFGLAPVKPEGDAMTFDSEIQGIIHISEFAGNLEEMKKQLEVGKTYAFKIDSVKPEEKRIILKLKK